MTILAKIYFCRQKLFLPVRFLSRKKRFFHHLGFSTIWQKPANPAIRQSSNEWMDGRTDEGMNESVNE